MDYEIMERQLQMKKREIPWRAFNVNILQSFKIDSVKKKMQPYAILYIYYLILISYIIL
jgi:hypothetical protein